MASTLTVNPDNVFQSRDLLRQFDLPYATNLVPGPGLPIVSLVEQSACGRMIILMIKLETILDNSKFDMKTV